jgi:hypothetical protein
MAQNVIDAPGDAGSVSVVKAFTVARPRRFGAFLNMSLAIFANRSALHIAYMALGERDQLEVVSEEFPRV